MSKTLGGWGGGRGAMLVGLRSLHLPRTGALVPRTGALVPRTGALVPRTGAPVPRTGAPVPRPGAPVPRPGAPVPRPGVRPRPRPFSPMITSSPGKKWINCQD
jgi:hypothetical protein